MGFFGSAASRVRNLLRLDKDRIAVTLAKGATGSTQPVSGFDLLQSYGHDALQDYLRVENDLMSRFVDAENADEYPESSSALDVYADDACITGDTIIPMLDGSYKTVKELYDNNVTGAWVYGFDTTKKEVVPAQFERVAIINESLPVYEVKFIDKFGKTGSIKATADHKWLMLSNEYVPTKDLKIGDRLNAMFKFTFQNKDRKQWYENVWVSYSKRWRSTHRMVVQGTGNDIPSGSIVHHVNHIGTDNRPENLQVMTKDEHLAEHQRFTGKNNLKYKHQFVVDDFLSILENEGYLSKKEMEVRLGCSYRIVERLSREAGYLSYKDLKLKMFGKKKNAQCHNNQIKTTKQDIMHFERMCSLVINDNEILCTEVANRLNINYKKFHLAIKRTGFGWPELKNEIINNGWNPDIYGAQRLASHNFKRIDAQPNDVITSIELIGNDTVYDLINSLPTHNFAAGSIDRWVFIKNSQHDALTNKALWVESPDRTVKEVLTDLYDVRLRLDEDLWADARTLCKYGSKYDELLVTDDGLVGTNYLSPPTMRRIEGRRGELFGFIQDTQGKFGYSADEFRSLIAQRQSMVNTFSQDNHVVALEDWEVVHCRLRGKQKRSLYGSGVLDAGRWIWKRLMLLEDAAMIYELERAPQRYAFYVDTGDMPPKEAYAYLQKTRQAYKKTKFFNPNTNTLDMRHSPLSQTDDFFLSVRKGESASRVEVLNAPKWNSVETINYFRLKYFSAIKVPMAYLGYDSPISKGTLCLSGDTKVPLLDGRTRTIKELTEEYGDHADFYVYSCDENGKTVPGLASCPRMTRPNAEVWELELDDGTKIKATPDHPFMMRDGSYKNLKDLIPGESLMPLYRKVSEGKDKITGYEKVYHPGIDKWQYTHQMVADEFGIRYLGFPAIPRMDPDLDELIQIAQDYRCTTFKQLMQRIGRSKTYIRILFKKNNISKKQFKARYLNCHKIEVTSGVNHKVKSIKFIGYEDCFDLTVAEHHNFAIGSSDPGEDVGKSGYVYTHNSQLDVRFCRTVLRIQRELRNGYARMGRIHLAALNIDPRAVDFEIYMTVPGAIFEMAQMEARNAKADFAGRMSQFVSMHWILTKVFGLSEPEVEFIIKQRHEEQLADADIMAKSAGLQVQAQGQAQQAIAAASGPNPPEPGSQQAEDLRQAFRQMGGLSRIWPQRRQMYGYTPMNERELFEGNRDHEKRMEDNFEKIMKNDLTLSNRLVELRELVNEIRMARPR